MDPSSLRGRGRLPNSKHKSLSYSHFPELMKMPGKLSHKKMNNYIKIDVTTFDGIQIFNLQYLYDVCIGHTWNNTYLLLDRMFANEIIPTIGGYNGLFNNPLSQVVYAPLRELCRHFDGYDHVNMDRNACPPLELPNNTFEYSKEALINKMTAKHSSYWTENNDFTPPQDWIDTMLSLYTIDKYTL